MSRALLSREAFAALVEHIVQTVEPPLRLAVRTMLTTLRDRLDQEAFAAAVKAGDVAGALRLALDAMVVHEAAAPVRRAISSGVIWAGERWTTVTPRGRRTGFDALHPSVAEAVAAMQVRRLGDWNRESQEAVRLVIADGLRRQQSMPEIAHRVRTMLGLPPRLEEAAQRYETMLRTGDRIALRRGLRDATLDARLTKHLGATAPGVPPRLVQRAVTAYRRTASRWVERSLAQTLAHDVATLTEAAAWRQAIREGRVEEAALVKEWRTRRDARVRPHHAVMEGIVVGYHDLFDVPVDGIVQWPGENAWGCRCHAWVRPRLARDRTAT